MNFHLIAKYIERASVIMIGSVLLNRYTCILLYYASVWYFVIIWLTLPVMGSLYFN